MTMILCETEYPFFLVSWGCFKRPLQSRSQARPTESNSPDYAARPHTLLKMNLRPHMKRVWKSQGWRVGFDWNFGR